MPQSFNPLFCHSRNLLLKSFTPDGFAPFRSSTYRLGIAAASLVLEQRALGPSPGFIILPQCEIFIMRDNQIIPMP